MSAAWSVSPLNPLQLIRETTAKVLAQAKHVSINEKVLADTANKIATELWEKLGSEASSNKGAGSVVSSDGYIESVSPHDNIWVNWDFESIHFCDAEDPSLTAQYLFVLDSLNFCFWPYENQRQKGSDFQLEYAFLATSLRDVLQRDRHGLDAERLIQLTSETFINDWFKGVELPQVEERVRLLREVGYGLLEYFDGKASVMIEKANKSAARLVDLVTKHFYGFRDHCTYRGFQVFLYKRAQIFVGDVWGAFDGKGLGEFHDIDDLTMFADYRVPQLLRDWGIMKYSDSLANKIDHCIEIDSGSEEEVEIRAATVQCVEMLRQILRRNHRIRTKSIELDWMLWQRGENIINQQAKQHSSQPLLIKPHHRTLTIYY